MLNSQIVEKVEPLTLTIKSTEERTFTHNGISSKKIVLAFEETADQLVLNDENEKRIVQLTGTKCWESKWAGFQLTLYTEETTLKGIPVRGIRVKVK